MKTYDKKEVQKLMDMAVDALQKEYAGLRTGRASTSMLDPVTVEAYGGRMPLNQVASVSVPEPRLLTVQVWDNSLVKATEKAIREAGLGLNPQPDGALIRVPVPDLNEERRNELVKVAGKYAEQARISVRNARREAMDALKKMEKDNEISEDEHKRMSDEVQNMTDEHIKKIDDMLESKEKDIMQV